MGDSTVLLEMVLEVGRGLAVSPPCPSRNEMPSWGLLSSLTLAFWKLQLSSLRRLHLHYLQSTNSGLGGLLEPKNTCRAVGMLTNRKSIDLMTCMASTVPGHHRHSCPGWRGLPLQAWCAGLRSISGPRVGAEEVCCELDGLESGGLAAYLRRGQSLGSVAWAAPPSPWFIDRPRSMAPPCPPV